MFQIELLPAREGDCLLLTYGTPGDEHRVLIDGGRAATYPTLKQRVSGELDLLVVTHIDRDHIEGVLAMLEDHSRPMNFRDVWFNGYDHLHGAELETFGAVQGERLTSAMLKQHLPWNRAFQGKPVESPGVVKELEGGLKLTLLSPTRAKLEALIPRWEKECAKAGLIPGVEARKEELPEGLEGFGAIDIEELSKEPFELDEAAPNGTSIALLAEFEGKRALLAADAHPDLLASSLKTLSPEQPIKFDAVKVSHHGSSHNTSRELLDQLACPLYLISTSGAYFHHPTPIAMSRLIRFGGDDKEIAFNYRSEETGIWDNTRWKNKFGYRTRYPAATDDGTLVISL